MYTKFSFIILLIIFVSLKSTLAATDKVICYYENGATESNNFAPEDIDVDICTHINYSFFGINGTDGNLRVYGTEDIIRRVSALKSKNPKLKVLFSVGGWGEDPVGFSRVAADPVKKVTMAKSTLSYINKYNYDGLDLDWEYPAERGGIPQDRENFVDMLRVLRAALGNRLLTVAVWNEAKNSSYDIPAITKIADFINLMTYDLHHPEDGKTGQNSPLYGSPTDSEAEKGVMNCDSSITNWVNAGAVVEKITLGMGFYGKVYQLADPKNHSIGSPVVGYGTVGVNYADICQLTDGWTEVWDDVQKNPYKYKGDQWVGYDNPRSIREKVIYAKNRNLTGVMMWSVNLDDKEGNCGPSNTLLKEIKENL